MEKLPRLVTDKFGKYIDMNAAARQRRAGNITYQDDQRYNDHKGALWLNVKNKDYYTIAAAVLTGMYDVHRIEHAINIDEITASKEAIKTFLHENQYAKTLVSKVWNFLKQYMSKGTITVYRGITLTNVIADLIKKDKFIYYNPAKILQYVDNTTKEFNSFSVDSNISQDFATEYYESQEKRSYITFSAEVDNNDINWAFTAYLDGRHGGVGESELNINNLKKLKNVKVIDCYLDEITNDMQNRLVMHNISSAIQNAFTQSSDAAIADKLREIKQYNIEFYKTNDDNLFDKVYNWRIMRMSYIAPNNVDKSDDFYNQPDEMYIAYNVKTNTFLHGATITAYGKCLLVTKDRFSYEGSIYVEDDNKPAVQFTYYKNADAGWFANKSNILILKLQDNMYVLFDCNTGKYIDGVKYYNIVRDQDLTDEENFDLYRSLNFSLNSYLHGVICTDEHDNVVAVYTKHDKYRQPISSKVLNGGYVIQTICKAKGKNAYYVIPRDVRYYRNGEIRDIANKKLVDDDNNTLLTKVHEIYNAVNGQSFATVIVDTSDTYYKFKLVDLNTLSYVSDIVFNDIISYPDFTRNMNEFVVLERLKNNNEQSEYNVLINQDGTYVLGFDTWANHKSRQGVYVQFDFDNYSVTFNMQTRKLVKGTIEDLQLANK